MTNLHEIGFYEGMLMLAQSLKTGTHKEVLKSLYESIKLPFPNDEEMKVICVELSRLSEANENNASEKVMEYHMLRVMEALMKHPVDYIDDLYEMRGVKL